MSKSRYASKSYCSGVCNVCYSEGPTEVHHIVPISAGGPNTYNNMVELCLSCHSKAHGHTEKWRSNIIKGIQKAKRQGKYTGRKAVLPREPVYKLFDRGFGASAIAEKLKISRASVYRILGERQANATG